MSSVRASLHFSLRSENPNVGQQRLDRLAVDVKWKLRKPIARIQADKY